MTVGDRLLQMRVSTMTLFPDIQVPRQIHVPVENPTFRAIRDGLQARVA